MPWSKLAIEQSAWQESLWTPKTAEELADLSIVMKAGSIKVAKELQARGHFSQQVIMKQDDMNAAFVLESAKNSGVIGACGYGSPLGGTDSYDNPTMKLMKEHAWGGHKGLFVDFLQLRPAPGRKCETFDDDFKKYERDGNEAPSFGKRFRAFNGCGSLCRRH